MEEAKVKLYIDSKYPHATIIEVDGKRLPVVWPIEIVTDSKGSFIHLKLDASRCDVDIT